MASSQSIIYNQWDIGTHTTTRFDKQKNNELIFAIVFLFIPVDLYRKCTMYSMIVINNEWV